MPILLAAHNLGQSFGSRTLFEEISFGIESGERIGLIGPNGAGKTTLLRILASQIRSDEGELSFQKGLKVAFLEQTPEFAERATVLSTAMEGVENAHDWEQVAAVHENLRILNLEPVGEETPVAELSGLLAGELICVFGPLRFPHRARAFAHPGRPGRRPGWAADFPSSSREWSEAPCKKFLAPPVWFCAPSAQEPGDSCREIYSVR